MPIHADHRNVDFSQTVELAGALWRQGVYFERLIITDEIHGASCFVAARLPRRSKLSSAQALTGGSAGRAAILVKGWGSVDPKGLYSCSHFSYTRKTMDLIPTWNS